MPSRANKEIPFPSVTAYVKSAPFPSGVLATTVNTTEPFNALSKTTTSEMFEEKRGVSWLTTLATFTIRVRRDESKTELLTVAITTTIKRGALSKSREETMDNHPLDESMANTVGSKTE
jgi:hypothetical protein